MAPAKQDTALAPIGQEQFQEFIRAQMREAVRMALLAVLEEEITVLIGANPYERTATRRDHRNGYYARDLDTSVGHLDNLSVPRTRRGHQTQVFERYQRRRAEVDQTISEMFVRGVSTQGVGLVLEQLNGTQPQCLHRLTGLSFARRRIYRLEKASAGRTLCLLFCRWHLLQRDLRARRLQNAHFSRDWRACRWSARGAGFQRR